MAVNSVLFAICTLLCATFALLCGVSLGALGYGFYSRQRAREVEKRFREMSNMAQRLQPEVDSLRKSVNSLRESNEALICEAGNLRSEKSALTVSKRQIEQEIVALSDENFRLKQIAERAGFVSYDPLRSRSRITYEVDETGVVTKLEVSE